MKVFISQPMKGKTEREIAEERAAAQRYLLKFHPEAEFLDSYFKDYDGNAVQFLGKSIMLLGEADLAVFLPGWADARGCVIEEKVAREYGIIMAHLTKEEFINP